ncbi:MAG TPA: hypothetical protein PKZ29_00125 [Candidatus Woesebacteria bacterium]|nr:hypothetical protein [Candidatus Woesebacteria bacterium]
MSKLIKHKYFWPILTFLFTIPAFFFLLKPGYYNMHDDMQMIRQLEMEKCFQDGQIPCRWTPDLGYGYGYPLFNFYPPMPYLVGQVYRTFGFSFVNSVKATAVTQIILAAAFMYLLSASIFGPAGGFIASIFYTYAPYHALNIFVRGAMNEAWAAVFFPLTFYYARKLVLEQKNKFIFGLGASFAGILLSHNPMALTFTPILFFWVIFWIFSRYKKPFFPFIKNQFSLIIKLILSGLFAAGLTAFYTIPVLLETKYVQINTMFEGYYHFSVHFAGLYQLFISNFWGDGASVWGPNDDMSFMVGYLHWIIPLILVIFSLIFIYKSRSKISKLDSRFWLILLLVFMAFFTIFLTHNKSTFIWLLFPIIQKIQFPWRFLNHSSFLLSLSIGGLTLLINKYFPKKIIVISLALSLAVLLLNLGYFTPIQHGPITDEQKFSGKAWVNQVTSGIYDYLPTTARIAALGPAKEFIDDITPKDVFYTITGGKKGSDWMLFNLNLNQSSRVILSQLAFPKFVVLDNGKPIATDIEPELGRLVINLDAGYHQIFVKFTNTPVRTVSNYISLVTWLFFGLFLSHPLWRKSISKK